MFLLDTCVVSESIGAKPDPSVAAWMKFQGSMEGFISVLTLGELHHGVAGVNDPIRERKLNEWIAIVERQFANRVVVVDDLAARQWGYLRAAYPKAQMADALLASTAIAHGFTFATRNVEHFRFDGLRVVNPWEA